MIDWPAFLFYHNWYTYSIRRVLALRLHLADWSFSDVPFSDDMLLLPDLVGLFFSLWPWWHQISKFSQCELCLWRWIIRLKSCSIQSENLFTLLLIVNVSSPVYSFSYCLGKFFVRVLISFCIYCSNLVNELIATEEEYISQLNHIIEVSFLDARHLYPRKISPAQVSSINFHWIRDTCISPRYRQLHVEVVRVHVNRWCANVQSEDTKVQFESWELAQSNYE